MEVLQSSRIKIMTIFILRGGNTLDDHRVKAWNNFCLMFLSSIFLKIKLQKNMLTDAASSNLIEFLAYLHGKQIMLFLTESCLCNQISLKLWVSWLYA